MEEKEWVDVINYEGKYQINKKGDIKSVDFTRADKNGKLFTEKGKYIKKRLNISGYPTVSFHFKGKCNTFFVHKLVAQHFILNPFNKPQVHHIDHNKQNSNVENLMWVTRSENIKFNYSTGNQIGKTNMKGKFGKDNPTSKQVKQLDLKGNLIKVHQGISEAAREINGQATHIVKVCKGILNKHREFKWAYI